MRWRPYRESQPEVIPQFPIKTPTFLFCRIEKEVLKESKYHSEKGESSKEVGLVNERDDYYCLNCGKKIDKDDVHTERRVGGQLVADHVHCRDCKAKFAMVGDENGVVLQPLKAIDRPDDS